MNAARSTPLLPLLLAACHATSAPSAVRSFGTMREVLRMGQHQGRVAVATETRPGTVGVGALAGLAGEVTILDGRALVSQRRGDAAPVRPARAEDHAALLVAAEVPRWTEHALAPCADYAALEEQVHAALLAGGFDPGAPTPVKVTGRAPRLQLHVIAGACPVATPGGPPPWRFDGPADAVTLVGFFVEGAAGRLTHHTHRSHLHAVTRDAAGHLDELQLEEARLFLPAR